MFLQERNTFINDQAILAPSERPLTTWKLREEADNQATATALEAVTTDRAGKVLGRWTVGETGKAQQNGQIVRWVKSSTDETGSDSLDSVHRPDLPTWCIGTLTFIRNCSKPASRRRLDAIRSYCYGRSVTRHVNHIDQTLPSPFALLRNRNRTPEFPMPDLSCDESFSLSAPAWQEVSASGLPSVSASFQPRARVRPDLKSSSSRRKRNYKLVMNRGRPLELCRGGYIA